MSNILDRQNQPKALRKLAAQREVYSRAKRVQGAQLLVIVVGSMVLGALAIPFEGLAGWAALYSIVAAMADALFFEPWLAGRKALAASIQESFDCEVLALECAPFKAANPPI